MELLKEMNAVKVGKKGGEDLPDCVAGADGEAEIVEKFREVYQAHCTTLQILPKRCRISRPSWLR